MTKTNKHQGYNEGKGSLEEDSSTSTILSGERAQDEENDKNFENLFKLKFPERKAVMEQEKPGGQSTPKIPLNEQLIQRHRMMQISWRKNIFKDVE